MLSNLTEKEKGYLFGLFEGDGYKHHDKKQRHYRIEFYLNSVKDKDIIKMLVALLKKINLNPLTYQDKRCNCKRISINSSDLFGIINKSTNIRKYSKDFQLGFVSGIIDSEGYVNQKKSSIGVVNTNYNTLRKCKISLENFNVKSIIKQRKPSLKDKLKSYKMHVSVNFKKLPHLSTKAGRRP